MKLSKRDALATFCRCAGLTRALGLLPAKPLLLVLNYHRIGDRNRTPFDSDSFSCSAEQFQSHLRFLQSRLHLATLDEAIDIVEKHKRPAGPVALLTFDDGYLDNYELAFPALARCGVQGVFFLPTALIGSHQIPWWDAAAYIVKHSRKRKIRLGIPPFPEIDLDAKGPLSPISRIIEAYKDRGVGTSELFLAMLEEACDSPGPGAAARCFMNWQEAVAMLHGGMAIGSHAHTHQILSKLPEEEQRAELIGSKRILEERLGAPVQTLSYPVGHRNSFSAVTRAAVASAGYRAAFSYYNGFNGFGAIDPYDVRRLHICPSVARFRLQVSLAVVTGRYWF